MTTTPLKLKIQLRDMPHKVIRKILVPENITMDQLHLIIQDAMGWLNGHLYEFSDKLMRPTIRIDMPNDFDDDFTLFGEKPKDANKTYLKEIFLERYEGKPFWYTYDFGDSWEHRISFQKPTKKQLNEFEGNPICVEAVGKCPPEDIGGAWGYADFLDRIRDKNDPERDELREWYGIAPDQDYDENQVDIDEINEVLKYNNFSAL